MRNLICVALFNFLIASGAYTQIYVSNDGNDNNPGTIQAPFKTITAGVAKALPGDTIFLRGGTYNLGATVSISKSGNLSKKYYLLSYRNERTLLDFSTMPFSGSNRGLKLSGSYWFIKGIDIRGAGDNGMNVSGSNNIIEFCSFYENQDTGLQLGNGASNNQIINCDSYYNADPSHGNADGFAAKLDVGSNNYFYGCRAWQNSDDGWDGYLRGADNINTVVENSWCFNNGYLKNGTASSGNGNGYKMGGGDNGNSANLSNNFTLINSIAFDNRVKGFDQNNNRGSMILHNCTAYRNGSNYSMPSLINSDKTAGIINCVALGSTGNIAGYVIQKTNSWHSQFSVSAADFKSIDTTGIRGHRQTDGSLPDLDFLHLTFGSDLIDAGTNIGLPFDGGAPDLGCFEYYEPVVPVELASFTAETSGEKIFLSWKTSSELNSFGFEIQRRNKGEYFKTIAFQKSTGTGITDRDYKFEDRRGGAVHIEYRLRQLDYSGSETFSDIIEVHYNTATSFTLSQNYPNPFNSSTNISFSLSEQGIVNLTVYNILGQTAAELICNEYKIPGNYIVSFDASHLTGGTYIFVLSQGNKRTSRSMILLK